MDISSNSSSATTITTAAATTSGNINIWSERSRSPTPSAASGVRRRGSWRVPPAARDSSRARRGDRVSGGRGEGVGGVAGGQGKYEQYDDAMTHTGRTSKPELPLPESAPERSAMANRGLNKEGAFGFWVCTLRLIFRIYEHEGAVSGLRGTPVFARWLH